MARYCVVFKELFNYSDMMLIPAWLCVAGMALLTANWLIFLDELLSFLVCSGAGVILLLISMVSTTELSAMNIAYCACLFPSLLYISSSSNPAGNRQISPTAAVVTWSLTNSCCLFLISHSSVGSWNQLFSVVILSAFIMYTSTYSEFFRVVDRCSHDDSEDIKRFQDIFTNMAHDLKTVSFYPCQICAPCELFS